MGFDYLRVRVRSDKPLGVSALLRVHGALKLSGPCDHDIRQLSVSAPATRHIVYEQVSEGYSATEIPVNVNLYDPTGSGGKPCREVR